jgi:16S rRNA (cytosine1402-N4)-methyltransferase
MTYQHTPVMLKQVMEILNPISGQNFIDGTLGGGGYTEAILEKILPEGKVLAIDLDEQAIETANKKFKTEIKNKKIILAHDNFKNLPAIVNQYFKEPISFDGIVFDLGLSSNQLQDKHRGFSFGLAGSPLKMNFGSAVGETAENIINSSSVEELTRIFRDYGEEKFSYKIALAIIAVRQINRIETTGHLVRIILSVIPKRFQKSKIHPATKVFQALRIAVNQELNNLQTALPQAVDLLKSGGKIVVISYHSLEDRIVKQYFRKEAKDCLCPPAIPICQCGHKAKLKILHKGILRPTEEEVLNNPRSRSAKLRAAIKI